MLLQVINGVIIGGVSAWLAVSQLSEAGREARYWKKEHDKRDRDAPRF